MFTDTIDGKVARIRTFCPKDVLVIDQWFCNDGQVTKEINKH